MKNRDMLRLNKEGYEQLIDEDIAWLESMPRSIERDRIIVVLLASVEREYPSVSVELHSDDDTIQIRNAKRRWAKEFPERVAIVKSLMDMAQEDISTPDTGDN
jgi:hypothetical protein